MKMILIPVLAAVSLFAAEISAKGETIRLDFSGTAAIFNDAYGDLAAAGIPGPFSGSVVYDTTGTPWRTDGSYFMQYSAISYNINIGDNFSWSSNGSGIGITVEDNGVIGANTYDMFLVSQGGYATINGKNVFMDATVWMRGSSLDSLTSTDLPDAGTLNDFNIDETFFDIAGYTDIGKGWDLMSGNVKFHATSVPAHKTVPEPATLVLFASVLTGLAMMKFRLRNRIMFAENQVCPLMPRGYTPQIG